MKFITSRTAFAFTSMAVALSLLTGCLKSSTSPDNAGALLVTQFNLAGNWYNNQVDPGNTGYHNYLNISSTGSYYSIGVELWPSTSTTDTVQIYTSRFTIEKYLEKNLFLTHKNAGKGNGIDIDFTCTTPHARCPAHDDTLDYGGVMYLKRVDSTLFSGDVRSYIGDGSKTVNGKFYSLRYYGNQWIKSPTLTFWVKNGVRIDYESDGTVSDSGSIITSSSTFTYGRVTNEYAFIGDTLHVYGSSDQGPGFAGFLLEYKPSDKPMPSQLFQ